MWHANGHLCTHIVQGGRKYCAKGMATCIHTAYTEVQVRGRGGVGRDGHISYRKCRGVGVNMESAPAAIDVVHSVDDG